MQPALLVPTVSVCDYRWRRGFQFTVFRGCRVTIHVVLAFSSGDYYMHSRTEIQGTCHSVCPSNCQLSSLLLDYATHLLSCLIMYVLTVPTACYKKRHPTQQFYRIIPLCILGTLHLFLQTTATTIWLSKYKNGWPTEPTSSTKGQRTFGKALFLNLIQNTKKCGIKFHRLNTLLTGWRPSVKPGQSENCMNPGSGQQKWNLREERQNTHGKMTELINEDINYYAV